MTGQIREVPRFVRPYDTSALDDAVRARGAAIIERVFSAELCDRFIDEVRKYLADNPRSRERAEKSILGSYQGPETTTLHALIGRVPVAAEMIVQPDLLGCAKRILAPLTTSVLLTVAEYMGRDPGQPRQQLHRDTEAWAHLPLGEDPVALTLMCAMSDFTVHNGATWVVLDSHRNPAGSTPKWSEAVQATMSKGDALIFRSDVFHAGGANDTAADRREIFSLGYQVGWLRTVENSTLSVPPAMAATLPEDVQELLGYSAELVLGLYEGGHPKSALTDRVDAENSACVTAPKPESPVEGSILR